MLDRLERMLNWNPDWARRLLPWFERPQHVKKDRRYFLRIVMPYVFAVTVGGDMLFPLVYILILGKMPAYPSFLASYLWLFVWFSVQFTLPYMIVGCLYCLPSMWAWNRRAARLQKQPIVETTPEIIPEGVWPPAPHR